MTRARNPRRILLPILRQLAGEAQGLVSTWNCGTTMGERTANGNLIIRKRETADYPENQPETWRATATHLDQIAKALQGWASWCRDQADSVADGAVWTPPRRKP